MEQDVASLGGEDYFAGNSPCCSDSEALSQGDKDSADILELNQFDGLPYSSRFYKLMEERKELPMWRAKSEFMDTLANQQFVAVSGFAKTGRSSQVSVSFFYANIFAKMFLKKKKKISLFFYCRFPSGVLSSACQFLPVPARHGGLHPDPFPAGC